MGSLWNRSGTIERYGDDLRADGAQAFFFQGGTTTAMSVYADSGESDAYPHPVVADANGRWPDIFVPYTLAYDVQVKSKFGELLSFTQRIPNPNPIDQTVVVPPERQIQTGMIHAEFTNAPKTGYVRLNGKTIGNGLTSGPGSERANDDTIDLYRHLWNNITTNSLAPVLPGGRGASADADFGLNKTLTLPDMRGAMFAGLDDMGNSPAGNFGTLSFTAGNSIITASVLGANTVTLVVENMPAHVHTGSTATNIPPTHSHGGTLSGGGSGATTSTGGHNHSVGGTTVGANSSLDHTHGFTASVNNSTGGAAQAVGNAAQTSNTGGVNGSIDHTHNFSGNTTSVGDHNHNVSVSVSVTIGPDGTHTHTFTTDSKGGEGSPAVTRPFNNMPITRLVTWYIKL